MNNHYNYNHLHSLVERRRNVKKLIKSASTPTHAAELDIRQKALKLTANSMYGCLGFAQSRFQAQPIAALITSLGRAALQSTVDIATNSLQLEVIYGDTDSIMINTHIDSTVTNNNTNVNNSAEAGGGPTKAENLAKVRQLGLQVKKEVNKLYKTLELEIDGIFRTLLMLKKKKYAAITVDSNGNENTELKGLDLVRRDWCIASKDIGKQVLNEILHSPLESAIQAILRQLETLNAQMRSSQLPLEKYVITKSLSKHPNDYPDGNVLPHVYVARKMLKDLGKVVNTGDHIPYVICDDASKNNIKSEAAGINNDDNEDNSKAAASKSSNTTKKVSLIEQAYHPDEILRDPEKLTPKVEWYLKQQILPPISRLCEVIDGIDARIIAEKLGLDVNSVYVGTPGDGTAGDENLVDYVPASALKDEERFKDCDSLTVECAKCWKSQPFSGCFMSMSSEAFDNTTTNGGKTMSGIQFRGFTCAHCQAPHLGESNRVSCFGRINAAISEHVRGHTKNHYKCMLTCDDLTCSYSTRSAGCMQGQGNVCPITGCRGILRQSYTTQQLYTQLKYLDSLFSIEHATRNSNSKVKKQVEHSMSSQDEALVGAVHEVVQDYLKNNEGSWVNGAAFFGTLFNRKALKQ